MKYKDGIKEMLKRLAQATTQAERIDIRSEVESWPLWRQEKLLTKWRVINTQKQMEILNARIEKRHENYMAHGITNYEITKPVGIV